MALAVSTLSIFFVAACVFVPIFGIAFFMLKSARRAAGIAAVFALGSVFGFLIAGALARWAVGHGVSAEVRAALGVAFAVGGAVAGGVLAVWALERNNPNRPGHRS